MVQTRRGTSGLGKVKVSFVRSVCTRNRGALFFMHTDMILVIVMLGTALVGAYFMLRKERP